MGHWYAIKQKPGTELAAADRLGSRGFSPREEREWIARGKLQRRDVAHYTGIMFVQGDMGDPYLWEHVANGIGFNGVIGLVRDNEWQRDQTKYDAQGRYGVKEIEPEPFVPNPGDKIKITAGLYTGQIAKCIWANKNFCKLFVEGTCNVVGAYLNISTKDCVPLEADKVSDKSELPNRLRPRRKHRGVRSRKVV